MIHVIGLGPGSMDYLTPLAQRLLAQADWVVGAERQLAAVPHEHAKVHLLDKKLMDLVSWLEVHKTENVVVLASGDPMLYGIGKFLNKQLGKEQVHIVSGISSMQYVFSRVGLDMNDVYLTSSHGKTPDFDFLFQHEKVAMVTDDKIGPYQIAQEVIQRGLTRTMIIGENLSYPNEQISILSAHEVKDQPYQMNVVVIYDER